MLARRGYIEDAGICRLRRRRHYVTMLRCALICRYAISGERDKDGARYATKAAADAAILILAVKRDGALRKIVYCFHTPAAIAADFRAATRYIRQILLLPILMPPSMSPHCRAAA